MHHDVNSIEYLIIPIGSVFNKHSSVSLIEILLTLFKLDRYASSLCFLSQHFG